MSANNQNTDINLANNQDITMDKRMKKKYSEEEIEVIKSLFYNHRRQETQRQTTTMKHLRKTKYCKSVLEGRECSYGIRCHFSHSEHELVTTPKCSFGRNCRKQTCQFSHTEEIDVESPQFQQFIVDFMSYYNKSINFKTKMCKFVNSDTGCHNENCTFAHSEAELTKSTVTVSNEPLIPSQLLTTR